MEAGLPFGKDQAPDAHATRPVPPRMDPVPDDAAKQRMQMTTARLKALEQRVGATGTRPMRSRSSGVPTLTQKSMNVKGSTPLQSTDSTERSSNLKVHSSLAEPDDEASTPMVVLSHSGMENDLSDSSDTDPEAPPDAAVNVAEPHFSTTGLVSDGDASLSDEMESSADDASEDSNLDIGEDVSTASSRIPTRVLSSSESAFVQRMRMSSNTREFPSVSPFR